MSELNAFGVEVRRKTRHLHLHPGKSEVFNDDTAPVEQTSEYDWLHRRIVRAARGATYDNYYNESWQLLEERKNGDVDPLHQYVWHPYQIMQHLFCNLLA